MNKKKTFLFSLLVLMVASAMAVPAFANTISLTLDSPVQTGTAGSTLSFSAIASTPSANVGAVFLNGDSFNVAAPLTLNDSAFYNNYPLSLGPNGFFSGLLFTVMLPSGTSPGMYAGTFTLQGGADGNAANVLATVNFNVKVASAVPEPTSVLLLVTGLACFGVAVGYRRAIV